MPVRSSTNPQILLRERLYQFENPTGTALLAWEVAENDGRLLHDLARGSDPVVALEGADVPVHRRARRGHAGREDVPARIRLQDDLGQREDRGPRQVGRLVRGVVGGTVAGAVEVERLTSRRVRTGSGRVEGDRRGRATQMLADPAVGDDRAVRADATGDVRGPGVARARWATVGRVEIEQEVRLVAQRVVEEVEVEGPHVVLRLDLGDREGAPSTSRS